MFPDTGNTEAGKVIGGKHPLVTGHSISIVTFMSLLQSTGAKIIVIVPWFYRKLLADHCPNSPRKMEMVRLTATLNLLYTQRS